MQGLLAIAQVKQALFSLSVLGRQFIKLQGRNPIFLTSADGSAFASSFGHEWHVPFLAVFFRAIRKPGSLGTRASQLCVLLWWDWPEDQIRSSCQGSCVYRRNRTYGSCLQQPTRTVRIGHGSPPFQSSDSFEVNTSGNEARSLAKPSRFSFKGDCRSRFERRLASPLGHRP